MTKSTETDNERLALGLRIVDELSALECKPKNQDNRLFDLMALSSEAAEVQMIIDDLIKILEDRDYLAHQGIQLPQFSNHLAFMNAVLNGEHHPFFAFVEAKRSTRPPAARRFRRRMVIAHAGSASLQLVRLGKYSASSCDKAVSGLIQSFNGAEFQRIGVSTVKVARAKCQKSNGGHDGADGPCKASDILVNLANRLQHALFRFELSPKGIERKALAASRHLKHMKTPRTKYPRSILSDTGG